MKKMIISLFTMLSVNAYAVAGFDTDILKKTETIKLVKAEDSLVYKSAAFIYYFISGGNVYGRAYSFMNESNQERLTVSTKRSYHKFEGYYIVTLQDGKNDSGMLSMEALRAYQLIHLAPTLSKECPVELTVNELGGIVGNMKVSCAGQVSLLKSITKLPN